jgi:hypothetical protein
MRKYVQDVFLVYTADTFVVFNAIPDGLHSSATRRTRKGNRNKRGRPEQQDWLRFKELRLPDQAASGNGPCVQSIFLSKGFHPLIYRRVKLARAGIGGNFCVLKHFYDTSPMWRRIREEGDKQKDSTAIKRRADS